MPHGRTFTASPQEDSSLGCFPEIARAELPLAVVAAHSQTLDDGSAQATLAAIIKRLVVCGGHSESQLA